MLDPSARPVALLAASLLVVVVIGACSTGSTPSPSTGAGAVSSAEEAVELVLAQDPLFAPIPPYDPDLIGLPAWTKVEPTADGWQVTVRIGWGDCPSGCIDEHVWTYEVTTAGEVTLRSEEGPEVPADFSTTP